MGLVRNLPLGIWSATRDIRGRSPLGGVVGGGVAPPTGAKRLEVMLGEKDWGDNGQ